MSHDHVGVMLGALLAVPVPDGFTSAYREIHNAKYGQTFRDVTISPAGLDVHTFDFGTPGAYAHICVSECGDTYIVGVIATRVCYIVQGAGHVVAFTNATDAVSCAIGEIRGHLRRQERGW